MKKSSLSLIKIDTVPKRKARDANPGRGRLNGLLKISKNIFPNHLKSEIDIGGNGIKLPSQKE